MSQKAQDDANARVAATVRHYREVASLTVERLAHAASVSATVVSALESGTTNPTLRVLSAVANALNVPVAALVDDADPEIAVTPAADLPRASLSAGRVSIVHRGPRREVTVLENGVFPLSAGTAMQIDVLEGEGMVRRHARTVPFYEGDLVHVAAGTTVELVATSAVLRIFVHSG